jgi:hypothetical protein
MLLHVRAYKPSKDPDTESCNFNFLWMDDEPTGPTDPLCRSKPIVVVFEPPNVFYPSTSHPRCLIHAAWELADDLCSRDVGLRRVDLPEGAFDLLCKFFELYIRSNPSKHSDLRMPASLCRDSSESSHI